MTDPVVSPLLKALSERLDSSAYAFHNDFNCKKMMDTLQELRSVVLEVEEKSLKNERTKFWLMELKDIVYDADGLVDDCELLTMKSRKKVSNCFPLYWHRNADKMRGLRRRFDEVLEEGTKYLAASKSAERSSNINVNVQSSSFVSNESAVCGRDEYKEQILGMLLGRDHLDLKVVPVVGMGGIGKTTLAQLVYNDDRVKQHFNLRIWVPVGQEFDLVKIAEAIMYVSTGHSQKLLDMDVLETAVRRELKGQRFLCVLDDVWSENQHQWETLRRWFSAGDSGSAVMLTTRNTYIASFMTTGSFCYLEPLSESECWDLFESLAFGSMTPNAELQKIGKQIVRRCKGLPLAIKILGSLLRHKTQVHEWLSIMENDAWDFQDGVLPVLKLSYDHLPAHLKQCFAYCSVFPKDYAFNKEKLIRLWIAEGFVESTISKELEDVADEYFVELLHRSFFQDTMTDPNGITVEYQMHDLVHDLALCVVGIESAIVEEGDSLHVSEKVRRISLVHESGSSKIPERVYGAKKLRTLFSFSGKLERIPLPFLNFRYLRVLGLSQRGIHELPDTIGTLKHLRYLDLSHTYIKSIPESIGNLKYLQTLELSECYNLVALPKAICHLTNLRHLDIRSCSLIDMPSGIGNLSFLQNLPAFILGKQADCAELIELGGLKLRGRLDIKNLENVRNSAHARKAKLPEKQRLRSLGLSWGRNAHLAAAESFEVLEALVPPPGLEVLDITGYNASVFPSWIASCLSNVVKVSLIKCSCLQLPPLGKLPFLRDLFIKGMPAVCSIGYEFYKDCNDIAFPALRQLELYDMPNLLEWKLDEKVVSFPFLDTLRVKGCSKLTGLPSILHLSNLALWDSDELLLDSLAYLTSLSSLALNGLRDPKVFPWDLGSLNYIKQLTMYDCDNLESLFEDMRGFSSLQQLSILYCHKLESLPVGLRYLDSLKKLDIVGCEQLADMLDIVQCLSSLEELVIEGCPMLRSFLYTDKPIRLQKLVIKGCPQLEQRLVKERGEDWSKILHIPYMEINCGDFITEEDILWESDAREAHIPQS